MTDRFKTVEWLLNTGRMQVVVGQRGPVAVIEVRASSPGYMRVSVAQVRAWVARADHLLPPCPACGGTGMGDSGGFDVLTRCGECNGG